MLFSPEQLARVREIIQRYHVALVFSVFGPDALPEDVKAKLREAGVPIPEGPLLLQDAYGYGQLFAALMQPSIAEESPEQVRARIEANPIAPTQHEEAANAFAANHAGQYVVGLGNRVASDVVAGFIQEENGLTPDDIKRVIADTTSQGIEQREATERVKSNLGHQIQNWTRDWLRIATTEVNNSMNAGMASVIERRHGGGARVSKIPKPDACEDCKRLYLDEDGNPKIFYLSELYANGSNVGRHRRDWKPVIGVTHPWCACTLVHIPDGVSWANGEMHMALPDEHEPIVEPVEDEETQHKRNAAIVEGVHASITQKSEEPAGEVRQPKLPPIVLGGLSAVTAKGKPDVRRLLRGNLGVPRELMPQIPADSLQDFLADLTAKGVSVTSEMVPVHELRATQNELHPDKILDLMGQAEKEPVIVSLDHFLFDGHHRWAANACKDPGAMQSCIKVHLPIYDLLEAGHDFGDVEYRKSLEKGVPAIPIGDGSFGDGTTIPKRPKRMSLLGNEESPKLSRMQPSKNVGFDELIEQTPEQKAEAKKRRKKRAKNAKRGDRSPQMQVAQASLTPRAEGDEMRTAEDFVPQTLIEQRAAYNDPEAVDAKKETFANEAERRKQGQRGIVDVMRKLPEVRR